MRGIVPEPWPTFLIALIGPGGVVGTLFALYVASERRRCDECCQQRDDYRKANDDALAAYRRRDEELMTQWRVQQRVVGKDPA
jgi:hypothetical protein